MPHCKLLMIFDGHKMCYMEDVNKCHFQFQKYSKQLKSNSSKKKNQFSSSGIDEVEDDNYL